MTKKCCLVLFLSFVSSFSFAQTKFIGYKDLMIPMSSDCPKPKVIITTDIREGGSINGVLKEEDDTQSLIHYLSSSYRFNTVGLISTPGGGDGSTSTIDRITNAYGKDRSELVGLNSANLPDPQSAYPSRDHLRSVTRQGLNLSGSQQIPTYDPSVHEGAKLIRDEVSKIVNQGRCGPVYVLVWGSLSEVAIALNGSDGPGILTNKQVAKNLRLYVIGSSNIGKAPGIVGDNTAYEFVRGNYIENSNSDVDLWMIESNFTFGGFEEKSGYGADSIGHRFIEHSEIKNESCLAQELAKTNTGGNPNPDGSFASNAQTRLKMGDSPSVFYLMNGDISNPETPSWGGLYRQLGSKSYFVDLASVAASRDTINDLGHIDPNNNTYFATNSNSIYGAWFKDLAGVGGCD